MAFDTSIIEKNRERLANAHKSKISGTSREDLARKQREKQESIKAQKNSKKSYLGKISKEEVLNVVRSKGPITTAELKRNLKVETYLISAILSELVNSKQVKLTNVKKGTGIFYYIPSQEPKLEPLIEYLNSKDQDTVKLLKEKKVIEDKTQELFTRVSVRKIPDFAKPIKIRISENDVRLFWKYFLVSDAEAKEVIREILTPFVNKEKTTKDNSSEPSIKLKKPKIEKKEEVKQDEKRSLKKEIKVEKVKVEEAQARLDDVPSNIEEKLFKDKNFLKLKEKLKQKNITMKEAKSVRKGKEYDLVITINTAIGKTRFFAKYKNKKRCNDADISTALVVGQSKNLPVAFITPGTLTKKTKEQKDKLFKNVIIVEGF